MATVMFIHEGTQNPSAMRAVINYCLQEHKTFDSKSKRRLVSGINCDGENAYREFMATKKVYEKDNGMFFPIRRTIFLLNLPRERGLVTRFWSRLTAMPIIFIRTSSSILSALNQE